MLTFCVVDNEVEGRVVVLEGVVVEVTVLGVVVLDKLDRVVDGVVIGLVVDEVVNGVVVVGIVVDGFEVVV